MKNKLYAIAPALLAPMSLFADAAPAAEGNSLMKTLSFFGIVLVFFYLILWRPEQKRRKKAGELRNTLKPGDRVTAMGIIGKVDKVNDNTIVIKMVEGAKIEMLKAAVSEVHAEQESLAAEAKTAPKEAEAVQS